MKAFDECNFIFIGNSLRNTKLHWIFDGFILLGIMLLKSRNLQHLIDLVTSYSVSTLYECV